MDPLKVLVPPLALMVPVPNPVTPTKSPVPRPGAISQDRPDRQDLNRGHALTSERKR